MSVRWIYSTPGQAVYYREGDNIFSSDSGNQSYYVDKTWWYEAAGGRAAYYESGDTIFTTNGKPVFYYGR